MTPVEFVQLLLVLAISCAAIAWLDEHIHLPKIAEFLGIMLVILSITLISYGTVFWLWDIIF